MKPRYEMASYDNIDPMVLGRATGLYVGSYGSQPEDGLNPRPAQQLRSRKARENGQESERLGSRGTPRALVTAPDNRKSSMHQYRYGPETLKQQHHSRPRVPIDRLQ